MLLLVICILIVTIYLYKKVNKNQNEGVFNETKYIKKKNEEMRQRVLSYDDSVSEKEIKQALSNIQNDKLTIDEVEFLKYINNKKVDIKFSPRWEFEYEIRPRIEVAKLLKLQYITYSSWKDNIQNSTMTELKEVLKLENLKVSGNKQELIERAVGNIDMSLLKKTFNKSKYVLTEKGKKVIEQNKILFMSDKEKAGKEFEELSDLEYKQLQVFGKVERYKTLKHNELAFTKGYSKYDILWSIYNEQKDIYIRQKDYTMAGVVYERMSETLEKEGKYEQATQFLICCMYLKAYEALPHYETSLKKYCDYNLKKLLEKCNKDINDYWTRVNFITKDINKILKHYIPQKLLDIDKISKFRVQVNQFLLDT